MWPDSKPRRKELIDKADFFEYAGYPQTAKWIRHLADQVMLKNPVTNLEKDLDETLGAYRSEFIKGDALKQNQYDRIFHELFQATKTGILEKEILTVMPLMQELFDNVNNMNAVVRAFKPFQTDPEMHFYGMSFMYLLNVEGIFDQAVRIIYGLTAARRQKPVPLEKLNNMSFGDLSSNFPEMTVLFEGYQNHVRNAIAHCRFRFDKKSTTMNFRDIDMKTKKVTYDESWTREKFSELIFKLDDVWHTFQNVLFLIRIVQLVLAKEVPRAGMDLIMPQRQKS